MARPQKEGLDYFPLDLDIDQDDKLIVPIAKYGMKGFGVIVRLMMEIYRNGYFYHWSEREQYVFSNKISTEVSEVLSVVNECINWGFFNENLHSRYKILTSKGFQKRYIEAAKRRKEIVMLDTYVLIDPIQMSERFRITISIVNADGNQVNVYKNYDKSESMLTESTQSKVKESKVNQSKGKKEKRVYPEDSLPYKIAKYLHQKIMNHAEESGVAHLLAKSNLQMWSDDCRKLIEIDKIDKDLIREVIEWSTAHRFWKKNILSASKLREQFQKLAMEMADEKKGGNRNGRNQRDESDPESDNLSQFVRR